MMSPIDFNESIKEDPVFTDLSPALPARGMTAVTRSDEIFVSPCFIKGSRKQ